MNDYLDEANHAADAEGALFRPVSNNRTGELDNSEPRNVSEPIRVRKLEVRSHVLTLREGEFDSRLRDRERTIEELNMRHREMPRALRKEQAAQGFFTDQGGAGSGPHKSLTPKRIEPT